MGRFNSRAGGIVLFVSLALLLAITVAALSAAQTTILELRMARNSADGALAFHAAEAALAEAEAWLAVNDGDPAENFSPRGIDGLFAAAAYGERDPWHGADWTGQGRVLAVPLSGVEEQPRTIVEWVATFEDSGTPATPLPPVTIDVFRITARGSGATSAASVLLQSTYGRVRDGGGMLDRATTGRLSWADLGA